MSADRRYPRPAALPDPLPERLILEASAGTGKTYALEHIVLELLLRPQAGGEPLRLPQILVATFTEKAAAEMRERVRALVAQVLAGGFEDAGPDQPCWTIDGPARRLLERALLEFDRATITTIHGFCRSQLGQTAFLTGEPFQAELVEGRGFFRKVVHELMRRSWGATGSERAAALAGLLEALPEDEFSGLLYDVRAQPGRPYPDPRRPGPALDALAACQRDPLREQLAAQGVSAQALNPLLKKLDAVAQSARAGELEPVADLVEALVKDATRRQPAVGPARLLACAAQAPGSPAGRVASALLDLHEALDNPAVLAAERFLQDACVQAERVKAEQGLLDFDDMARRVAAALDDPAVREPLAKALRGRYRMVLLDEFQDTSPEQWRVFANLFGAAGRICLIGDPKQAIYGFRGGDVHAYLSAQEELRALAAVTVPLRHNFRSTPLMLEACNRILDQLADPPFFTGAIGYPRPVQAGRPGLRWVDPARPEGDLAPVRLVRIPADAGRPAAVQQAAARHLARELRQLLELGPELRDGERREPLRPEDVFVLTRTAAESDCIHQALREAGVPVCHYKRDKVFATREAAQLLDLLRAVADPGDAALRARALLTPAFGAGLADLRAARDLPDGHPYLEQLRAWSDLARSGRCPELFQQILGHGLLRRLIRAERDDHAASVWLQLADFALEQCAGPGGFRAALRCLEDCVQGRTSPPGEDAALHRAATDRSAVQILTMHKAKGLQAKVVALFSGFGGSRAGCVHRFALDGESRFWIGPGKLRSPRIREWAGREEREEAQRLLYVALTRAEAQLLLPVFLAEGDDGDDDGPLPKGDYRALNGRLRALLAEPDPRLFQAVDLDGSAPGPLRPLRPDSAGIAVPEPPDPGFWSAVEPPPAFESFTSLARDLEASGPADPETAAAPPDPRGIPGGARIGTCLHAMLERLPLDSAPPDLDFDAWRQAPGVAGVLQEAVREAGFDEGLGRRLAGLAFRALRSPLHLPAAGASVTLGQLRETAREMAFLLRRPDTPDYLEGFVDLLFQWQGRSYFVDWKSNVLADYGPASCAEVLRAEYGLQFILYTLAVCRFLEIAGPADYEARFGGGIYVFLRGLPEAGQTCLRPSWEQLRAWERALARRAEGELHVDA